MRVLWVVVVFAVACSAPPPATCERFQVTADGVVFDDLGVGPGVGGGFAGGQGGAGGGIGGFGPRFPVRGEERTVTLFSALSACDGDALAVRVEVTGPDSQPVDAALVEGPTRSARNAVSATVRYVAQQAGLYVVKVAFEPALGTRTLTDEVVENLVPRGVPVSLQNVACLTTPWPVGRDAVACEASGAEVVVLSSDGGVARFGGSDLAVVDTVLWSRGELGALERAEWDASVGARVVTHRFEAVTQDRSRRGEHTRDTAVRGLANGNLVALQTDGGRYEASVPSGTSTSFWVWDEGTIKRFDQTYCFDADCLGLVVALSPDKVWVTSSTFPDRTDGFIRPVTDFVRTAPPQSKLTMPVRLEPAPPGPLVRLPLWIDAADGSSVLLTSRGAALEASSWRRAEVLRVGSHHVLLQPDAGTLLVVPDAP